MGLKISRIRIFSASVLASVALVATAQTADLRGDNQMLTTLPDRSAAPSARDFGRIDGQRRAIAPTNVLDDGPRDVSGKPPLTACDNNVAPDKVSPECRRLLEIARIS